MAYADLYAYCQTLEPKIKRKQLRDEVLKITGTARLSVMKTALDVSACRGFYLSAKNTGNRFVQQHGSTVIVLARDGLNHCWERFVFAKELMHLFDDPKEATDTGDAFEAVLKDIIPMHQIRAHRLAVKRRRTGTPYRRRRGTPLALWFAVERRRSA